MPHSRTFDCLVLASYDVGEADRFVILLTREEGRLAARVPGARRLKSRLASLLPLTHCSVELKETRGGYLVSGIAMRPRPSDSAHLQNFLARTQVSELLLALLSDGEPVPEIFETTRNFLQLHIANPHHLLAYSFRLLHLLGVLPEIKSAPEMARLSAEEKAFIEGCKHTSMEHGIEPTHRLAALCERMVAEHATRPLKAPAIAAACHAG